MQAEVCTFHDFPSSCKQKLKCNCYVSFFSLKLDATPQLAKNIKMINLLFIVSIVSSKKSMLMNLSLLNGAVT